MNEPLPIDNTTTEDMATDRLAGVQQIEDKQLWVGSTVNGAYERIEDPKASPPVQPEIQLLEGWRNGNIKMSAVAPTVSDKAHTWDIWLEVTSLSGGDWTIVKNVYVRVPT